MEYINPNSCFGKDKPKNEIEHHSDMEPLRWAKLHPSYDGSFHCLLYPQYTCKQKRKEKKNGNIMLEIHYHHVMP